MNMLKNYTKNYLKKMRFFSIKIWKWRKSLYLCNPVWEKRSVHWNDERDNEVKKKEKIVCIIKYRDYDFKRDEKKFISREVTRANGGCLGFWRRGRTWKAAKRCGDLPTRNDPHISEWGNPREWSSRTSKEEQTQGTETSQYLQEKKENRFPE